MNIACPTCGHMNAEDARFCVDCRDRLWSEAAPPHEPVQAGRRPEPEPVRPPEQRGALHVTVETGSLAVAPGEVVSTTILVHNSGTQNDTVSVTVDGSAREWASVEPESFTVFPNTEVEATVRFAPPHAPSSEAGPRWYTVRVSSGSHPGVADTAEGTLAIGAFRDLDAELVPRETRGRWRRTVHAVRLTNSGNVLEQVALEASGDDESLQFTLPGQEASVAPGAVATLDLQVRAPRKWIGRPKSHPFHVEATSRGVAEAERLDGTRVAVPLLARWMGLAAALAVLAVVAALVLPPMLNAAPTEPASETKVEPTPPTAPPAGGGPAAKLETPAAKPEVSKPPETSSVKPAASVSPVTPPPVTTTAPPPAPSSTPPPPPAKVETPVVVTPPPTTPTTSIPPPPPPPVVVSTGRVELANPSSIDLDRGVVPDPVEDGDLDLTTLPAPSGPVLAPRDDTRVVLGGVGDPTVEQCRDLTPSTDPVRVADLKLGSVLCVVTDQGHLAVVRIDRIPTTDVTLQATYTTFEKALMRAHDHHDEAGPRLTHHAPGVGRPAATCGRPEALTAEDVLDLQRTAGNAAVTELVGRSPVLDVVGSGGGTPLDADSRTDMEGRLGHDFGDVRIHTDARAQESAEAVSAHAYTVGAEVVFGRGQYDPSSAEGKKTLAHELTHVVQQRSGPVSGTPTGDGVSVSDPSDSFEREAVATAERVVVDD